MVILPLVPLGGPSLVSVCPHAREGERAAGPGPSQRCGSARGSWSLRRGASQGRDQKSTL